MSGKLKITIVAGLAVGVLVGTNIAAQAADSWQLFGCDNRSHQIANSLVDNNSNFDVVIYGGTPSAVAAATTAARQGRKVLVLSEGAFFGGAISNGLSATDIGSISANVGLSREFLHQVKNFYHDNSYRTEPKVAECIFDGWLNKPNIKTGINTVLDSATVVGNKITDINFHTGTVADPIKVTGKTFIDASYAGDLMFEAGVQTRLGMSDFYSYNEPITKYRTFDIQFRLKDPTEVAQGETDFSKLPMVTIADSLKDPKTLIKSGMPSFTYRLCVTKDQSNVIPFAKTAAYDTYAPAWRTWITHFYGYNTQKVPSIMGNGTVLTQLWHMSALPNNKWDLNASYFTNMSMRRAYFDQIANRPAILAEYAGYLQSFMWFVQNDPSVPVMEKQVFAGFGLCADEFKATGGWPEQPYLREGRRLIGKSTITVKDILIRRTKADGIAAGSYGLDSKSSVFVYANGMYARDRGIMFKAPIYEIPFSTMLPKNGPNNLIVSVGISASPAAYASIRMEPQYIQLGQAAGLAASLAIDNSNAITPDLSTPVRFALSKANGFTSISNICFRMDPSMRARWGFDPLTCKTKKFQLVFPKGFF
jgi:hypothetical protein